MKSILFPSIRNFSGHGASYKKTSLKYLHVPEPLLAKVKIWLKGLEKNYQVSSFVLKSAGTKVGYWAVLSKSDRGIVVPAGTPVTSPEGYHIQLGVRGLILQAADERGLLYGLVTLFQMLSGKEASLPSCRIEDKPQYPFRSFQIDLARQPETMDTLKKWVVRLAMFKMNRLGLYLEGSYDYRCCPGIAPIGALNADSFKELAAFGKKWGVEVWPMMNCWGHMENFLDHKRYANLSEGREGHPRIPSLGNARHIICASMPKSRDLLRHQIEEWAEIYDGTLIHVGLDECWNFASCSLCRAKAKKVGIGGVFLEHLLFLREVARGIGKSIALWDDVVYWFPEIVSQIPKDVVFFDWEYGHVPQKRRYCEMNYRSVDSASWLVAKQGLQMVACPATNLENIQSFRRYCDPYQIQGFHITTWGLSYKLLDECFTGFAYGAETCWASDPVSADQFPKQLAASWFGTTDETVLTALDGALAGYDDQGNDMKPVAEHIRHEVTADAVQNSRHFHQLQIQTKKAHQQSSRHQDILRAINLNLRRTANSATLHRVVNETVVTIRHVLNHPESLHGMDQLKARLGDLKKLQIELKLNVKEFEIAWRKDRGSIPRRHNSGQLDRAQAHLESFIRSVERFAQNPKRLPVELGHYWIAIDFAEIDPNYRGVKVEGSWDGKEWKQLAKTQDCSVGAYRQLASLSTTKPPRYVRLTVSRIGVAALCYFSIIGWNEEWVPLRIITTSGSVQWPEHLLSDDKQAVIMGESDTFSLFHDPDQISDSSSITVELHPYVAFPESLSKSKCRK